MGIFDARPTSGRKKPSGPASPILAYSAAASAPAWSGYANQRLLRFAWLLVGVAGTAVRRPSVELCHSVDDGVGNRVHCEDLCGSVVSNGRLAPRTLPRYAVSWGDAELARFSRRLLNRSAAQGADADGLEEACRTEECAGERRRELRADDATPAACRPLRLIAVTSTSAWRLQTWPRLLSFAVDFAVEALAGRAITYFCFTP